MRRDDSHNNRGEISPRLPRVEKHLNSPEHFSATFCRRAHPVVSRTASRRASCPGLSDRVLVSHIHSLSDECLGTTEGPRRLRAESRVPAMRVRAVSVDLHGHLLPGHQESARQARLPVEHQFNIANGSNRLHADRANENQGAERMLLLLSLAEMRLIQNTASDFRRTAIQCQHFSPPSNA
jgi:hypothetical protein